MLWGREQLAGDMGIDDSGEGSGGIALAHNVGSPEECTRSSSRLAALGAVVTRAPAKPFYGGYVGSFRDPDGHAWEIAHNPGFLLAPDGSVAVGEANRTSES